MKNEYEIRLLDHNGALQVSQAVGTWRDHATEKYGSMRRHMVAGNASDCTLQLVDTIDDTILYEETL